MRRRLVCLLASAVLTAAAAATSGAQEAQLLRVPLPQDDGSLTPYTFERAYPLLTLVYDTLMWRDEDGVPRPWLARDVRRGTDPLDVEIRLRRDVRWHDGRPLTAADVVFTLRHVATHPHPRFTPQVRDIASVEARGRHIVGLRLRRASLGLLDQPLADVPILPRHLWERLPEGRLAPAGLAVGSGPYRLVQHRRGRRGRYVLEANESYFRGRPLVNRIEVPIHDRFDRAVDALRRGRADVLQLRADDRPAGTPAIRVVGGPSYSGTALAINVRTGPLARLRVRRALARALDLGRVARTVGGGPTIVDVHPALRGYVSPRSPWASPRVLHRFDPARARVAFAEEGIPEIEVLAPSNDPLRREAGRQVVLAVERAGGRARLVERAPAAVAAALDDGAFQAAVTATAPLASYDPAFLDPLFRSGSALNFAGYASPAFDAAADRLAAAPTEAQRRDAAASMLEHLARDLPVVPLFYPPARFGFRQAAFDRWVFVHGSGILDKRSLLPHRKTRAAPLPAAADPLDRTPAEDAALLPYALIAGVLMAAGAAAVLVRRRSARV